MTGADRRTRQRRCQAIRQRLASYEAWPRTGPGSGCSLAAAARDPGPREASGAVLRPCHQCGGRVRVPPAGPAATARPAWEDRWQGPLAGSQAAPGPAAHWPELRLLIGRPGPGGLPREPCWPGNSVCESAWQYYGMIRAKKRKANLKPAAEQ